MNTASSKSQSLRRYQGRSGIVNSCGRLSRSILLISLTLLLWRTQSVAGQTLDDYVGGGGGSFSLPPAPNVTDPPANVTAAPTPVETTSTLEPTILIPPDTLEPTVMIPAETAEPTIMIPAETMSPTVMTDSPTITTMAPTGMETTVPPETSAPTFVPTSSPTIVTPAPTNATASPTVPDATAAPTSEPTSSEPSFAPSFMPSSAPSVIPSTVPSIAPTTGAPTTPDTTGTPTAAPFTDAPTTGAPTTVPSAGPSLTPGTTGSPTTAPQGEVVEDTVTNLKMVLVGLNNALSPDGQNEWKVTTEEHTRDYYRQNPNLQITDVVTTVELVSQDLVQQRRLGTNMRSLQTTSISISYKQDITYRTLNPDITGDTVVLSPFQTPADLDNYLASLQDASTEFDGVDSVAAVEEGGGVAPTPAPEKDGGGGLGMGAIIGIVVGCVVGVGGILGVGYFVSQRGDDGGYAPTGKTPPTQLDVNQGPDEVSTLAEPTGNNRASGISGAMSGESNAGYGDQSVATVDYDYSKAYGGGGETSVSSAGGTFGSQTHTQGAGGAALDSVTGSNGADGQGASGFGGGQNANVREELIDIYAPPGKLGVVIDTPDDGAPVVHAVKDSSVIADKLQVGDKLVAVDDEDVRSMTAIKVSKLISRKSANASRKLSIIRTVVVDE